MYLAIVPAELRDAAGGDTAELAKQIAGALRREGTYAVVAGNQFRAGHVGRDIETGVVPDLATTAIERRGD
jgi:hypothetical protein